MYMYINEVLDCVFVRLNFCTAIPVLSHIFMWRGICHAHLPRTSTLTTVLALSSTVSCLHFLITCQVGSSTVFRLQFGCISDRVFDRVLAAFRPCFQPCFQPRFRCVSNCILAVFPTTSLSGISALACWTHFANRTQNCMWLLFIWVISLLTYYG